jgi:hypothetical protein
MSIYKKIRDSKKASVAKLNVFDATAKGVEAGQEAIEAAEDSPNKLVSKSITSKASALKQNDPPTETYMGRRNYKGSMVDYYKSELEKLGGSITIPGAVDNYDGSGGYMSNEDWTKFLQTEQGKAYTEKHSPKTIKLPNKTETSGRIEPINEKTDPSQQYNMGFREAEDANWARGAMRRGLNRDERKAIKNKVQSMSNEDRKKFRQEMKKQRKGTFLGLGIGGDRQERKIQALKNMGELDPNYKSYKSEQADKILSMDTEERNQKIESATMNKYNMPTNSYGDFKEGSSGPKSGEGLPEITDADLATKTSTYDTYFGGSFGTPSIADSFKEKTDQILIKGGITPLNKKSKSYKNKFGRGAGYKN